MGQGGHGIAHQHKVQDVHVAQLGQGAIVQLVPREHHAAQGQEPLQTLQMRDLCTGSEIGRQRKRWARCASVYVCLYVRVCVCVCV